MDREQRRIEAIRARNEARRERCLNARMRTIGVDVDALNQQVAEKEAERLLARQEGSDARDRDLMINRIIEERELEEKEAKRREMEALKAEWSSQRVLPKNEAPKMGDPVVPEQCGMGAVQRLGGEDVTQFERKKLQQQQMRSWTKQQMEERSAKAREEKDEEMRYAEYLKMLSEKRAELEGDEVVHSRAASKSMQRDNLMLAEYNRRRRQEEEQLEAEAKAMEIENQMNDPILCEDTRLGITQDGRARKDHYKGLTRDQVLHLYKQNEQLVEAKRASNEKEEDKLWFERTQQMLQVATQSDMEHKAAMKAISDEHKEHLKEQAIEQKRKRAEEMKGKFGSIDNGFFDGFGTSWR